MRIDILVSYDVSNEDNAAAGGLVAKVCKNFARVHYSVFERSVTTWTSKG